MKYLFFLFTLLPIMIELYSLLNIKKIHKSLEYMTTKGSIWSFNQKFYAGCSIIYMIWAFIGIISSQWFLFIVLIILSIIPKKWIIIRWLDAFLSLGLLFFMIINTFHLHINLFSLILFYF